MADEPEHLGDALRAYREREGNISRQELANRLGVGVTAASIAKIERKQTPGTKLKTKFRRLERRPAPAPPIGSAAPQPEPGPGESGGGETPDSAPAGRDLPPLPLPPDRDDDDGEGDDLVTVNRSKVSVRSLNHFARLELSMLVFFVGKEIEYQYPAPDGKLEKRHVHQPGIADMLPDPRDGAAIRSQAPEMAHAWADWARTNSKVHAFLGFFMLEGGFKGVVAASLPCVLTMLTNHGLDPVGFFLGPLNRQPEPPPFGAPQPEAAAPGPDGGAAGANGDGSIFDGTQFGFRNADAVEQ